jgi:hypothetical protein
MLVKLDVKIVYQVLYAVNVHLVMLNNKDLILVLASIVLNVNLLVLIVLVRLKDAQVVCKHIN